MRIVLYDQEDLEPITILEIMHWRRLNLPEGSPIRVAVMPEIASTWAPNDGGVVDIQLQVVNIRFERFHRNGAKHWLAMTNDTESALMLKAAFLPGQHSEVQERERAAFRKGFAEAFTAIIGR